MNASHFLLVDGTNLAFRSFYGIQYLSNSQQLPVNAIYGFFNSLLTLAQTHSFERAIICFDCGHSTARTDILDTYKKNRAPTPDDFKKQLPYIKELIPLFGWVCCERIGIEADDLIATWAQLATQRQQSVAIVSADKDLMQCVTDTVHQIVPNSNGWYSLDPAGVVEKVGVYPHQIVDYLALIGDSADNYLGLPGVGPKTAAKWLNAYQSIDGIYAHLSTVKPERFQSVLSQSRTLIERNQSLARLACSIDWIEPDCNPQPQPQALDAKLTELNLNKLMGKCRQFFQQNLSARTTHQPVQQGEFCF